MKKMAVPGKNHSNVYCLSLISAHTRLEVITFFPRWFFPYMSAVLQRKSCGKNASQTLCHVQSTGLNNVVPKNKLRYLEIDYTFNVHISYYVNS